MLLHCFRSSHSTSPEVLVQDPLAYNADPVRLNADYPEALNRILNLPLLIGTLIKAILAIPAYIVWYVIYFVAVVLQLIGTIAILFTGQYPRGLFNLFVSALRMQNRLVAYLLSMTDAYPGFSLGEEEGDTFRTAIDYPQSLNRLLNLPIIGLVVKSIFVLPHLLILLFAFIAVLIVVIAAQFAILFTGQFPRTMWNFVVGVMQMLTRVTAYIYSLTDKYPSFSMSPEDGAIRSPAPMANEPA
jgi:hypothetical protein